MSAPSEAGTVGQRVGPIRLSSTEGSVALEPLPFPLVDADGNPVDLTKAPVGVDLFLQVPADAAPGSAVIRATAEGSVLARNLLVADGGRTQTIVIVRSHVAQAKAEATVAWKQAP